MAKQFYAGGDRPSMKKPVFYGQTRVQEVVSIHFYRDRGEPGKRGYVPSFRKYCAELLGPCEFGEFNSGRQAEVRDLIRDAWMDGMDNPPLWAKLRAAHEKAQEFATEFRKSGNRYAGLADTMASKLERMIEQCQIVRRDILRDRKLYSTGKQAR